MNCPRCNAARPRDATYCPDCGANLFAASESNTRAVGVFCSRCETKSPIGSRLCGACGRPLPRPILPSKRRFWPWLIGALAATGALVGLSLVAFLFAAIFLAVAIAGGYGSAPLARPGHEQSGAPIRANGLDVTLLATWWSPGPAGQFSDPTGIAVDRAGNVYVVGRGNQRVQKFAQGWTTATLLP